jgi:hypothetical protein
MRSPGATASSDTIFAVATSIGQFQESPARRAFSDEYQRLLDEQGPKLRTAVPRREPDEPGIVSCVITQYEVSDEFKDTAPSTNEVYRRMFDWLRQNYGSGLPETLREQHVRSIRNKLKDPPSVADHIVDKIGMLWGFAKEHLEMKLGPNTAAEVAAIDTKRESHKAWPRELCAAFEVLPRPRPGPAYHLLRYTGQRRPTLRMRWDHFDGSAVEVVQQKNGTYVWIPCHPILQRIVLELPREGSTFSCRSAAMVGNVKVFSTPPEKPDPNGLSWTMLFHSDALTL